MPGTGFLWSASTTGAVLRWPRTIDKTTGTVHFGLPEPIVDFPRTEARALSADGRTIIMANGDQSAIVLHRDSPYRFVPTGRQVGRIRIFPNSISLDVGVRVGRVRVGLNQPNLRHFRTLARMVQ